MSRIACVWVPYFAAAAVERCEPALADLPLAVVRGTPPITRVVEANALARDRGVAPGMTEAEARARCGSLVSRPVSDAGAVSARYALLQAALAVSPRVEARAPGLVYVETDGLDRLFGGPAGIGDRLVRLAREVGLHARVGIASTRTAARVAACTGARVTIIPREQERSVLAAASLTALDLPAEVAATLARWGVKDLGTLAALPREALGARLGAAGLAAHELASGRDPAPFTPWTPPRFWEEAQELDWEIAELGPLVTVLRQVLTRLTARLAAAHLAADALDVHLGLASGARQARTLALAYPTQDVDAMLALIALDLEAHPPLAPVTGVAVSVRPVRARAGQGGLWQPPAPAHRDLATLLARLGELVGPDNVGSPTLEDSHRPDAVTLTPFAPPSSHPPAERPPSADDAAPRLMLRRLRPPRPVEVVLEGDRPTRMGRGSALARVVACVGPWRVGGEWWDRRAWARDEWDLMLADGALCRLAHDPLTGAWLLDGVYD